ncbi:MAG: hypothetical protein EOR99_24415 [Mesorhizobium sp.]|nr:MAG: hypothetical protein EOR99_24415 [Mesorhizobium sp.]
MEHLSHCGVALFCPLTGRRCRQADKGQRQVGRSLCCPSSGPSGHLLPVSGEKGRRYPCATITCRTAV